MNEQQNKDIHQLLIAVLLGEATPAEVAEVTTALAESAELRAERSERGIVWVPAAGPNSRDKH